MPHVISRVQITWGVPKRCFALPTALQFDVRHGLTGNGKLVRMPTCVQITNLTKCFGSVVAVGGLNLEVPEGEVVGLLGPNGAGKSTTLSMVCGLSRPTSGSISLFGRDVNRYYLDVAPRMGVLLERPAFYGHMSARRNLSLLARLGRKQVVIDKALDRVGLLPSSSKKVRTFSRGMLQRLGLAQALMTEPELLLLDEPTNGLDPEATQEILRLLRFLASEAKVTILYSSHLLHEMETVCDRVAILNRGRLVACEKVNALVAYDTTQVDVLVDAPDAAARRLAEQKWVESAVASNGRMAVRLSGGSVHQLTSFLVSNGFVVSGVIPRRRTLQDYFLKVLNK
ncbi:MAG: multidrug ABC transporter ATP-binding protein [Candidatus Hydrogenedentota bacterium]